MSAWWPWFIVSVMERAPRESNAELKKPLLAFTLSFLLPGAGLVYLGKWKWGLVNFGVVFAIGVLAALFLSEDSLDRSTHFLALMCASGSGSLATQLAKRMNSQRTGSAAPSEPRSSA